MNNEQERAEFEAFASKHGLCVTEDGDLYRSHVVAWMWKAWQARAALQSQDREDAERYRRLRKGDIADVAFARDLAMRMTAKADIPYCAEFAAIAQELDAVIAKVTEKENK